MKLFGTFPHAVTISLILPATSGRSTFPFRDRRCSFQFSRKPHCTYDCGHLRQHKYSELYTSFHYLKLPRTVAGGDKIGNTAALEESCQLAAGVEDINELNHFHQSKSDNSCLCVVSKSETIDEASTAGDDVLECTANLNSVNIIADNDTEVWCLEEIAQDWSHLLILDTDGSFTELLIGDLIGQVGAHQDGAWNLKSERLKNLTSCAIA